MILRLVLAAGCAVCAVGAQDADQCARCHAAESRAYRQSPMGKSIGQPAAAGAGKITQASTGSVITIEQRDGRMFHRLASGLTAEYPIAYQIGANRIGYSYLVQIGSYFFESPASWYRSHGWDLSPGYGSQADLDFDRLVDSRCLFCHADRAEFDRTEGHRFLGGELAAIGCDRCHGPGADHIRHPSAANIVSPEKLPLAARDSVCEQCHLEGETRILNPGKTWLDFRPGEPLEQIAATYVGSQRGGTVHAVSQAEQLAQSQCMRASGGRLWCATCHNPHKQKTDAAEVQHVCLSCHASLSKAAHPATSASCVSCHMPRLTPVDIPHASSTDHSIPRRPRPLDLGESAAPETLMAWREPPAPFRSRDLALAEIIAGDRSQSTALRERGTGLLEQLPIAPDETDAKLLAALAGDNLEKGNLQRALALARRAAAIVPPSALAASILALILRQSGDLEGAAQQYERATEIDPSSRQPWIELAKLYQSQGNTAKVLATIDRYLAWNPKSIMFRTVRQQVARGRH